jgi:hypothetical protein
MLFAAGSRSTDLPFGTEPGADGLEPALRWESYLAL